LSISTQLNIDIRGKAQNRAEKLEHCIDGRIVEENRTYQMSEWMKQKPFLCLNPTQKSEILAFLCNELLNNKVGTLALLFLPEPSKFIGPF
jgi:hypothetical protein